MNVSDIIKQVRWCVDEESGSTGDYEDTYFDNIVKAKIGASLRWCALYADAVLLTDGKGTEGNSLATDFTVTATEDATSTPEGITYLGDGCIELSADAIRVTRVRADGWLKSIGTLIEETSDEYLMQSDDTAMATVDRPVVALIRTNPMRIQLFPTPGEGSDIEVSVINTPASTDYTTEEDTTEVSIPTKMEGAFIYYLAYLVMCAHSDFNKANSMLSIAKQQIAVSSDND